MRRTQIVNIAEEGRDFGKIFIITEMPASQAEKWATRALLALCKAGVDIDGATTGGMAAFAVHGLQALSSIEFKDVEPLMDEMWACVKIQPGTDPSVTRFLVEDDIEEVATRLRLRLEVFSLHTGFSLADAQSKLTSAPDQPSALPNTPTSPPRSERVSRRA